MTLADIVSLLPRHGFRGRTSYLSDAEWDAIRETLVRGVTMADVYRSIPELQQKYTERGFYRSVYNRFGNVGELRRRAAS